MVSLEHAGKEGVDAVLLLLSVVSVVSLISVVFICTMCMGGLFRPTSLNTHTLKTLHRNNKKNEKARKKKKKVIVTPFGTSQAKTTLYSSPAQHPPTKPLRQVSRTRKEFLGRVQLHFVYLRSRSVLQVTVMCAQSLPAKDVTGYSDPYCKLLLLPACDKKVSTVVKQRTLSPVWKQAITFSVSHAQLREQTLYVYVLDHDITSRDDMIGECRYNLCHIDLDHGQSLWRNLMPCDGYASYLGEILLSLCYSPSREVLTVNIIKCTNLKAMDSNNFSDPYVKLFLWKNGKKSAKQKTTVKPKTRNPVYNETFQYEVELTKIHSTRVLIEVMDYDRMSSNDKIGCVMLGEDGEGPEELHWKEMCNHMDKPAAEWYRLKESVES